MAFGLLLIHWLVRAVERVGKSGHFSSTPGLERCCGIVEPPEGRLRKGSGVAWDCSAGLGASDRGPSLFTFATTPGPLDLLYLLHSSPSHHSPSCHMGHFLLNPDFLLNLNHRFFSLTSSLHHPWHLLLPSLNSYNIFYLHPVIQYIISKIALNTPVSNR